MPKLTLTDFFLRSGTMNKEQVTTVADVFEQRTVAKNDFFLKEGKISDEYMFLDKGFMRAYANDPDGNDITTHFYSAGNVVFEVNSFFNRTRSKENIQAITDCEGWSISFEQLNYLFHTYPYFREFGRGILVKGYSALKSRTLSVITETAEERYKHLIKTAPEIFQSAQLKHIASYLGITDTSLSRIRKEFAKRQ